MYLLKFIAKLYKLVFYKLIKEVKMVKKNKNYKKILIMTSLILGLVGIVFGASFVFDKTIWHNTQDFSYESGIGQERLASEFEVDSIKCGGGGTVYDKITNLCWQKNMNSTGSLNWTDAHNYCNNLVDAGGNWRLPEKLEFMTLIYHNGIDSTQTRLESIGFSNVELGYWSNTITSFDSSLAYVVYFDVGISSYGGVTGSRSVVCVKTA